MIEIQGGIIIGAGITIGPVPLVIPVYDFVTEDDNNLIAEDSDQFIKE